MTSLRFVSNKNIGRVEDRLAVALKRNKEAKEKLKGLLDIGRAVLETAEYNEAKMEVLYWQKRVGDLQNLTASKYKQRMSNSVGLGSTVRLKFGKAVRDYTIVTSIEADPANGFISDQSPLGKALNNKAQGDEVSVTAPSGSFSYQIVEVV